MKKRSEQEVDEELRFHLEEREREFIARGMTPEQARRAVAERFGDVSSVRDACTRLLHTERAAEERRTFMTVSWLDVKLGLRMLAKYPGLSAVAILGMALAIAIGAGYFGFLGAVLDSTLPHEGGDRVVVIQNRMVAGPDTGDRREASAQDYARWRGELKSITELGAFRDETRNLITDDGRARLIRIAEITASGLRLTHVAPLLGRSLVDDDERVDAPPVLVIREDEWKRHFDGDAGVIGRPVHLDGIVHTIVGVMPDGFGFPVRHRYWVPLRLTAMNANASSAPSIRVFGRLAPGFSLQEARAELATAGDQVAAAFPETHREVRPQVMGYTRAFIGIEGPEMEVAIRGLQLGVALLLLIVAVNVGILVYARTASRTGEIVVRTALGASRARVVSQLFVEALVLSGTAAALGLAIKVIAFAYMREYLKESTDVADQMPYWMDLTLSPGGVLYVAVLAVVAAVIVGVLPALKATGRRVQYGLQQFSSRGAGMQLGGTWTALIIIQVALAVAVLPAAMHFARRSFKAGTREPAPAAARLLRTTVSVPPDRPSHLALLVQRLESEPGVSAVTFAQRFPGQENDVTVETEGDIGPIAFLASPNRVAINLFEVFDQRVIAGRGFVTADARPGATAVIVDQIFASQISAGGNVVGRRIRYSEWSRDDGRIEPGPWLEIVGVVPAFANRFTAPSSFAVNAARLYQAAAIEDTRSVALVIQLGGGDPARFTDRLAQIAAKVDPALKLQQPIPVPKEWEESTRAMWLVAVAISAVTISVLLLSAAGIYAMMSFTVARRRREIGIRAALGADARRVLMGVFGRAGAQLGAGVATGLSIAAALEWLVPGGVIGPGAWSTMPAVIAVMFTVGLLAAVGPARRGLAIQPTEALREE